MYYQTTKRGVYSINMERKVSSSSRAEEAASTIHLTYSKGGYKSLIFPLVNIFLWYANINALLFFGRFGFGGGGGGGQFRKKV